MLVCSCSREYGTGGLITTGAVGQRVFAPNLQTTQLIENSLAKETK